MTTESRFNGISSAFGGLEIREPLTDAQIDGIARGLVAQLSTEEKIQMMSGGHQFFRGMLQLGSGGYKRLPLTTTGAIHRLGIPGIRFTDGPRGIMLPGSTTFPVAIARAASWDPLLEEQVGDVMGCEARAHGANMVGAPCINLMRHPAWGRAQESYGEDSYLLGEMGAALMRGIQLHVMSCVKHFALNSMENARFKIDVNVDQRTLHEIYLPHFKRLVDEGVSSVMSSYNSVNGEWAGQNKELLTGILQKKWGFQGYVQSDWIWGMRDAKKAALAGQHIEMPLMNVFHRFLHDLVKSGEVPMEIVDDAALRILRQQVRFGQGRDPCDYTAEVIGCETHRSLARKVAHKSIVLLKNEDNLLPLTGIKTVAVIGRLADLPNTGDRGSSSTQPRYVVTPLQGLCAAGEAPFNIIYLDGTKLEDAATLAKLVDVVICVVGYTYLDEGEFVSPELKGPWMNHFPKPSTKEASIANRAAEFMTVRGTASYGGDRNSLTLHPEDEKLIQTVSAVNPRTVVAIMAGSAVITEAWRHNVGAIIMLWYPGQEGGHAFADVLLGKVNPSGKLPCIFPRSANDLPFFDRDAIEISYDLWHGYKKLEHEGKTPAFPFGFGLSYTTFSLGNLRLAQATIKTDGNLVATVGVTNTGSVTGEEIVQLYVGARSSIVKRASKELKAFRKVSLRPKEMCDVHLIVPAVNLAYYDAEKGWIVEPGNYEVIIGRHSLDEDALQANFVIG